MTWRGLMAVAALFIVLCVGCLSRFMESKGGGETRFEGARAIDAADIVLPRGFRIEPVAAGLTFPTDLVFDDQGRMYVVEAGYSYGEVVTTPRIVRIEADGRRTEIARGDNPPWSGADYRDGFFYVAGGHVRPGQVLKIGMDGRTEVLVDGLVTSVGDHHTNGPRIGPDGMVYFAQGPLTNSGVVGLDSYDFGWLQKHPGAHDVPCKDIVLRGKNYVTDNPLTEDPSDHAATGAFMPFGVPSEPNQIVKGQVPCGGAIMRVSAGGGEPELVAWGLRNVWGLAFAPDGRLYATENQADVRGSRPIFGTADLLWRIEEGAWYGWPDFWAGRPLSDPNWFAPPDGVAPELLLAEHPERESRPAALLAVHSSSNGIAFSRSPAFGHVGQAFVAQFGDISPKSGKSLAPVGFKVVRVDVETGVIHELAVNAGETNGPASWLESGGLERPVNVRFSPDGRILYVVDFGVLTTTEGKFAPREQTGVIWRIERNP